MEFDPQELESKFQQINNARLSRLQTSLSGRQWDLLCAIPALLHINVPALPGFVEDAPVGLRNFDPDKELISALTRLVTGFRYQQQAVRQYSLLSVFMMGSSGSIAFTAHSDFDIWVCVSPILDSAGRALLEQKFLLLENWADRRGMEIHFFIVDEDQFQSGEVSDLSSESSGTAQRFLLLDEFYRTAILMAGLPPLWWIVPASEEEDYDQFVKQLAHRPGLKVENFIDFGPLANIPVEEFTGAGLWQVSKGIDSPYKSVMKIILMEAYIDEHPHTELASLQYKKRVEQGTTELDKLDPYLLMFEKGESFLSRTDQQERIELLRHCFYLKIGERLSQKRGGSAQLATTRNQLMRAYISQWGWDEAKIALLDNRSNWRITQVMAETRSIHRELSSSYTQLSRGTAEHTASSAISEADLHVLARGIYSALERRPGKIEIVNRKPDQISSEAALIVNSGRDRNGNDAWMLYSHSDYDKEQSKPIKRFHNAVELVLWSILNSVVAPHSRWLINSRSSHLNERELTLLGEFVRQHLRIPGSLMATVEDLAGPLRYTELLVLVNVGYEPFAHLLRKGVRITSTRSNPLCFGDSRQNTIGSIDLVYRSTWGEITCQHQQGKDSVGSVLAHYLAECRKFGADFPRPAFFSSSEQNGDDAARHLAKLFQTAKEFCLDGKGQGRRLIFACSTGFAVIERDQEQFRYRYAPDRQTLVEWLGTPLSTPVTTRLVDITPEIADLAAITHNHVPGSIQISIEIDAEHSRFHLLDEAGCYQVQSTERYHFQAHLTQLNEFVENVRRRLCFNEDRDVAADISFFGLSREKDGEYRHHEVEITARDSFKPAGIHVLVTPSAGGSPAISIIYDNEEFSSLEWGPDLYTTVAVRILSRRANRGDHPIYITDVDVVPAMDEQQRLQTVHYFKYKKAIEERLSDALALHLNRENSEQRDASALANG